MCGRFELTDSVSILKLRFQAESRIEDWKPNYNIAPTQEILTIIESDGKRILTPMLFGFIPHWSKQQQTGYSMINAKAETVAEKPSFRESFKNKRCLIPANGFYEWLKTDSGKQPYRIFLKNEKVFAFAGIWDSWTNPEGKTLHSTAILTIEANAFMRQLHDRMPVILQEDDEDLWLRSTSSEKLKPLLVPYSDDEMEMYRVSTIVNSVRNNTPDCIRRLE